MIVKQTVIRLIIALVLIMVAGCRASGNQRAPIEERSGSAGRLSVEGQELSAKKSSGLARKSSLRDQDPRAQIYVVQKGDTLYSIAFENGLDYREVAEQNNIDNPAAIQIGQQIKLFSSEEIQNERTRIESKPLSSGMPLHVVKKDQPKVIKLPYSEQAAVQIEKMQQEPTTQAVVATVPSPISPIKHPAEADSGTDDLLDWGMPTKGKVISEYSESANRKGVDIAGNKGQAVFASAAGKVVYSGSGLRGYGKLVIIKHNKTFLSAYAHNDQILVKEGQVVTKGQKIAEMGSTDADQVKLHFEIRKFGKPVDPATFLNLPKS
jgi:lipoprotein NlpD